MIILSAAKTALRAHVLTTLNFICKEDSGGGDAKNKK